MRGMLCGCVWPGVWWLLARQDHREAYQEENDQEDKGVGENSQKEYALSRQVDGEERHGLPTRDGTVGVEVSVVLLLLSNIRRLDQQGQVNASELLS